MYRKALTRILLLWLLALILPLQVMAGAQRMFATPTPQAPSHACEAMANAPQAHSPQDCSHCSMCLMACALPALPVTAVLPLPPALPPEAVAARMCSVIPPGLDRPPKS